MSTQKRNSMMMNTNDKFNLDTQYFNRRASVVKPQLNFESKQPNLGLSPRNKKQAAKMLMTQ